MAFSPVLRGVRVTVSEHLLAVLLGKPDNQWAWMAHFLPLELRPPKSNVGHPRVAQLHFRGCTCSLLIPSRAPGSGSVPGAPFPSTDVIHM